MTAPSSLDAKNPQQSRSPTLWIGNAALLVIAGFVSLALDFPDRIELWLAFVVIVIVGVTTQLAECMLPALFVMFALVSLALAFPDWFDLSLALVVIAIVGVASKLVQRKLPSSSPERIQILAIYAISFLLPASYNQSSFGMIEPQWDGSTLDYFRTVQSVSILGGVGFLTNFFSLVCANPVWLANPIWFVGVVLLGQEKWRLAMIAGLLSTSLALCAIFLNDSNWLFVIAPGTQTFHIRFGYYVWLGSMLLLTAAGCVRTVSSYHAARVANR